jgi:hypothetical protein
MGVVDINKKTLSEIDLYYGSIVMPKGFEINRDRIKSDILTSYHKSKKN